MKLKHLGNLLGLTSKSVPPSTSQDKASDAEANLSADGMATRENNSTNDGVDPVDLVPSAAEIAVVDVCVSSPSHHNQGDQPLPTQDLAMDEKSGEISYQEPQLTEGRVRLGEFLKQCEGSYGVIVSSIDGNAVVHQVSREMPIERLANMTSSLLALGETIARESLQRLCRFVILENSDGRVVCLRINRVLMLTCITSKQSNLGMALNIGQKTAERLARTF